MLDYFWAYPVPIPFWILGGAALLLSLVPGLVERLAANRFIWMGIGAVFVAGTILIPSENHLMGDGMLHLASAHKLFEPTKALDILVHHVLFSVVGDMLLTYRIIAVIAGAFYLWGVFLMSRLGKTSVEQAVIALSFLCVGTLQFYFGYVESYTLRNLFILFFIYFAWKEATRKRISWKPLLLFFLSVFSHFSAAALLPALVYLYRRRLSQPLLILIGVIALLGLVVAKGMDVTNVFVPIVPNEQNAYSLFTLQHLTDLLNILILSVPAFFLIFFGKSSGTRFRFALIAFLSTLLFSILINPVLGAFRDWDLLSVFALPLTMLVALRAPRKAWAVAVLLALLCIRVIPWLWFNSNLQAEFVTKTLMRDMHYSEKYLNGKRLENFGLLLERVDHKQLAYEVFSRRLSIDPSDENTLRMMAPTQFHLGKYQEALETYSKVAQNEPDNLDAHYKGAYAAFMLEQPNPGFALLAQVPEENMRAPRFLTLAAGLLALDGQDERAMDFLRAGQVEVYESKLLYVLAQSSLRTDNAEFALTLINAAIQKNPDNTQYLEFKQMLESRKANR